MKEQVKNIEKVQYSKIADYGLLVKFRLTFLVVLTSVLAFLAAGGDISGKALVILAIGGFCVTAAANAINQVFEKDFDILMSRTENRPVATGRMSVSEAVLFAGIMCTVGIILLSMFNPLTSFIAMVSFLLYTFVYTPFKRYSTLAVAIGAVPGALPALIGCTAASGTITMLGLGLFVIQFLWQFPHFWSISYLSFDDYSKAGFKFIPSENGKVSRSLGMSSLIYALLILPVIGIMVMLNVASIGALVVSLIATLIYIYFSYNFHKKFDRDSARRLMFCSFFYMPIILLACMFIK